MPSLKLAILLVCAASALAGNSAYGTHENILVDGVISSNGCKIIGGNVVTDTIDYVEPSRSIELCNYHDKYHFKMPAYGGYVGCPTEIVYWADPDTGFTYTFPSPCSGPRFYNEISCNDGEAQVRTVDKLFYVLLDGNNSSCSRFDFDKEEKKITMVVSAQRADHRMNVTIPSDLLGGKFNLMIDRGSTEDFLVDNKQGYSTISFAKFCADACGYQVEIIGTEATSSELLAYPPSVDTTTTPPKLLITNAKGERIEQPQAGQQVVVYRNYQNLNQQAQPYIMLFEFRDENGVSEYIAWQAGVAEPESSVIVGISWVPETRGEREVRVFVISDLENPIVLSDVYAYDIAVS